MAAMSLLRAAAGVASRLNPLKGFIPRGSLLARFAPKTPIAPVRHDSHGKRLFVVKPSQFYDKRFMKLLKFYILLTGIPAAIIITLINVFIGDAELAEIPEDYFPEYWEYYQHPITRFIVRYTANPPEKEYEKFLCVFSMEAEKAELRVLQLEARRLMRQRGDGPWFQYDTLDKNLIDDSPKAFPDA